MFDSAVGIRRPLLWRRGTLLIAVLAFSGCTTSLSQWWHNGFKVGPQYCKPSASVADQWVDSSDGRVKSEPAQDCAWWTVFNDATLNGLIQSAYSQNLDLRAAGARILQSRAQRNISIGNLFPQSQSAMVDYARSGEQEFGFAAPQQYAQRVGRRIEPFLGNRFLGSLSTLDRRRGSRLERVG